MTSCDVLIVGGGPAGSTLAAFLALAGVSVHLLERDSFPRYHIGESLIPQVLDVLEESGALAAVEAHGFLRKEGGVFRWGRRETPWLFYFDEASYRYRHTYAYQVIRSEFDQLLLDHARTCGVTVEERVAAYELTLSALSHLSHGVKVTATDWINQKREYKCRIVADCSGQVGWLARKHQLREYDPVLRNVAIFKYFRGATRMTGRDANGIFCEATPDGWFWNIPLHDGTNSVGLVTNARSKLGDPDTTFDSAFRSSWYLKQQLLGASCVSQTRTIRDYSYRGSQLIGPGFILVGDAGNFIDPVWSTGVFLATTAAKLSANAILRWLDSGTLQGFNDYQREMHRIVDTYREFIYYFYGANEEPEGVFWKAYSMLSGSIDPKDAFIRMVSGRLDKKTPLVESRQHSSRTSLQAEKGLALK